MKRVLFIVAYVLLHGPAACTPDQCNTVLQTPVVGEGLQILEKLIDGKVGVEGVGNAALCSDGQRGSSPSAEPDAFQTQIQSCSQCLTKNCTPELSACEKDTVCDGIAHGSQAAPNATWQAAAACVPQCAAACTVSTSSSSSASSSSGAGPDAGQP